MRNYCGAPVSGVLRCMCLRQAGCSKLGSNLLLSSIKSYQRFISIRLVHSLIPFHFVAFVFASDSFDKSYHAAVRKNLSSRKQLCLKPRLYCDNLRFCLCCFPVKASLSEALDKLKFVVQEFVKIDAVLGSKFRLLLIF